METTERQIVSTTTEIRTATMGFLLVGIAIAVTTVSYLSNMTFQYQWLVWVVGAVFAGAALITLAWSRVLRAQKDEPPQKVKTILLLAIPGSFILSSQVCGLGLRACTPVCHIVNVSLIGLAVITALRMRSGKTVTSTLIPMIIIGLIPHCVCHAPINTTWHAMLGGYAPTCEMLPLAATLFSLAAFRGARWKGSTALAGAMFGVMLFIIVGGYFFGFPWQGCIDHPVSG